MDETVVEDAAPYGQIGVYDHAHMSAVFRRQLGVSPSGLRRELRVRSGV